MKEIMERCSIRKYSTQKVSKEEIVQLVESARHAPSGSNTQPWKFLVIEDSEIINKFSIINNEQTWVKNASHLIVCLADSSIRIEGYQDFNFTENSSEFACKQVIRDTMIASTHVLVEAQYLKLGACMLAWFKQEDAKALFNIPSYMFVTCVIAVGYPAEKPTLRPRKKIDEIIFFDKLELK